MEKETITQDVKTESADAEGVNESVGADHKTESSVPYARFKEVNDRLKDVNDKLAGLDAKDKARNETQLAEEGKKDELIANLKAERDDLRTTSDTQAIKLSEVEDARRDELVSRMPDNLREKYSNKDKYTLEVLSDIVEDLGENRAIVTVDSSRPSAREPRDISYTEFQKQGRIDRDKNWPQFIKSQS